MLDHHDIRVSRLHEQIARAEYHVDPVAVADAMIRRCSAEMAQRRAVWAPRVPGPRTLERADRGAHRGSRPAVPAVAA